MSLHLYMVVIPCAWLLDAFVGDRENLPHPVRLIGWFIEILERWSRSFINNMRSAGMLVGLCVPVTVFVVVWLAVDVAGAVRPWLGACIAGIIIYTCLSTRCLADEA